MRGDLLAGETAEKQARSSKYQMTIAKLPLAKGLDHFDFAGTMINRTHVKHLVANNFLAHGSNVVLIGGTGRSRAPVHSERRPDVGLREVITHKEQGQWEGGGNLIGETVAIIEPRWMYALAPVLVRGSDAAYQSRRHRHD